MWVFLLLATPLLAMSPIYLWTNPVSATEDQDGDGIADGNEDFDHDGLTNDQERMLVTDSNNSDTNSNETPDYFEDTDNDKVSDGNEIYYGTDPFSIDSDGDSLTDFMEIFWFLTSPLVHDTDGDGTVDPDEDDDGDNATNLVELDLGTIPTVADFDGDAILDGDESKYGMSPTNPDTDGDGVLDGSEELTAVPELLPPSKVGNRNSTASSQLNTTSSNTEGNGTSDGSGSETTSILSERNGSPNLQIFEDALGIFKINPYYNTTIIVQPNHGIVDFGANRSEIHYSPSTDYFGKDSFILGLTNMTGHLTNMNITVHVLPVNDPPAAFNSSITAESTEPLSFSLAATDVENDTIQFSVLSGPMHGTLTIAGFNATYTASDGFMGYDNFTFVAVDPEGQKSENATVLIQVAEAPALSCKDYSVPEIAIISPSNGTIYAESNSTEERPIIFTINGTAYDQCGIQTVQLSVTNMALGGADLFEDATPLVEDWSRWYFEAELYEPGTYLIIAKVVVESGNEGIAYLQVVMV